MRSIPPATSQSVVGIVRLQIRTQTIRSKAFIMKECILYNLWGSRALWLILVCTCFLVFILELDIAGILFPWLYLLTIISWKHCTLNSWAVHRERYSASFIWDIFYPTTWWYPIPSNQRCPPLQGASALLYDFEMGKRFQVHCQTSVVFEQCPPVSERSMVCSSISTWKGIKSKHWYRDTFGRVKAPSRSRMHWGP